MKVEFHGAARGVTGSCYLVECGSRRILVDCGLYQGGRELAEENAEPFGFDPAAVDVVLLTHAHLDHCGRIPLLYKRGYRGDVLTTGPTAELARLVLLDAAGLQEEEARYRARKSHGHRARRDGDGEPLYTTLDALNSLENVHGRVVYDHAFEPAPGVRATFFDAGHILGSACILLELEENGATRRVVFSGDLGYSGRAILRDPAPPPQVDVVVMESTYGDRRHKPLGPSIDELYGAINATLARGGNVIIPTFALERAQEILYCLRDGIVTKRIDRPLTVFLDSPMAISATQIFKRYPSYYDEHALELFQSGNDPFDLPEIYYTRETAESMAINRVSGGAVILAGSGMCTGGRVRHHLRHNLGNERNSIVFVGYAARGTLARHIIDGATSVNIFGDRISVRARIHTIGGFSAHADQAELLAWHRQTGHPDTTFLVHGEPDAMKAFASHLDETRVVMPELHQSCPL